MDVFEKLKSIESRRKRSSKSSSLDSLVTARNLERHRQQKKERVHEFLPGTIVENDLGSFLLITERYAADHRQGFAAIPQGFSPEQLAPLAALDDGPLEGHPHVAYLDTETTGLAGGAGTFAFLVGLGFWQEGESGKEFVVEQYFMRDYDEEPAMLKALAERFKQEQFDVVASYNGRAFDIPLLTARFISNRSRDPISPLVQMDLLFPVRQLWKLKYGDCSLANIERHVLGVRREGDIPGEEISRTYFHFVRGGDPRKLLPIFSHNAQDVLSLAALTGKVVEHLDRESCDLLDPIEVYSLGRAHLRKGLLEKAALFLEQTDSTQLPFRIYLRSQRELSLAYKRNGHWERAVQMWLETVEAFEMSLPGTEEETALDLFAFEELAKYYEHQRKEYGQAIGLVRRAIELLESTPWPEKEEQLKHRLARLEKKAERSGW